MKEKKQRKLKKGRRNERDKRKWGENVEDEKKNKEAAEKN